MKTPWTKEEISIACNSASIDEAMEKLPGRSRDAVKSRRFIARKRGVKVTFQRTGPKASDVYEKVAITANSNTPLSDDRTSASSAAWQTRYNDLLAKYRAILKDSGLTDQLVADIKSIAPQSYVAAPTLYESPVKHHDSLPQSALLFISDAHIGLVVSPDQTLEFGAYNFDIFCKRLKYLEETVISITQDHTNTAVPELVVCFGGDMVHGALSHSAEADQINTLFTQFYNGGHVIAQFLRRVAQHFPTIRCYCTTGNHGRWQVQKKCPTSNRYSNLDTFMYALIKALVRDIPNIDVCLNEQPFAVFDVQGYTFHLGHGDHLRGGDRALHIPAHAIGRSISTNTQLFARAQRAIPNYYLVGHLHRDMVLSHAFGKFIVNGGFPGVDGYGLAESFIPVPPSQTFFFVHEKYGKTATYDVQLCHGDEIEKHGYELPRNFPVV